MEIALHPAGASPFLRGTESGGGGCAGPRRGDGPGTGPRSGPACLVSDSRGVIPFLSGKPSLRIEEERATVQGELIVRETANLDVTGLAEAGDRGRRRMAHSGPVIAGYGLTLWGAVTLVFLLPRWLPGDPLMSMLDGDANVTLTVEAREELLAHYGLDRSMAVQYRDYLKGLVTGDLGWSISQRMPVVEAIGSRLPWTAGLVIPAMVLSTVGGFIAGVEAAWYRRRMPDRIAVLVFSIARGIPDYVIAFAFLIALAVVVPLFPLAGARTPFNGGAPLWSQAWDVARHAVLPIAALSLSLLGTKFLLARSSMVAVLGQDYLLLARAKGLGIARVKYRHGARNAVAPVLAQAGTQFGFALGGAVFIEQVFAYPGIGNLTLAAVDARDYALLDGCFLVLAGAVIAANFMADMATAWICPETRVR